MNASIPPSSLKSWVSIEKTSLSINITTIITLGKNISKRVDIKFLFIKIKFFLSKALNFHAYDEDIVINKIF